MRGRRRCRPAACVGPDRAAGRTRALELRQAPAHEDPVPSRPVLLEEQHLITRRRDPCPRAGRLQLHRRDEPVDFRLAREKLGQDAPEPPRLFHQLGSDQPLARAGGVALVEDQIDDLKHRGQPLAQLVRARYRERDMRGRQRPLRPHDALRHGRLRHQVRPGDLPRRQPAKQPQGQRHPRVGGEHGMTGREDEPQKVVIERVVGRDRKVLLISGRAQFRVAAELLGLTLVDLRTPQPVDAAMLGGGHEPGARVIRDARTPATAQARQRAPPGQGPPPARHRAPGGRCPRSAARIRSATRPRQCA